MARRTAAKEPAGDSVRKHIRGNKVRARGIALGLAIVVAACSEGDRSSNKADAAVAERVEIVLTKIQNDGIQYVSDFTKQQQDTAAALARVKKVMEKYLFDPISAKYTAIQLGRNGSICGQYNAKNRYNAYVGFKDFVVTGDGRIYASDSNGGIEASLSPSYVQAFLDSCATKAQVAAHSQSIESYSFEPDSDAPDSYEQEPDRVLDAPPPPARKRQEMPADIPTA